MSFINERVQPEGLTFDDVLLIPAYSEVLPREVNVQTRFSRNISLNIPIVSAAMDTVTEAPLAIALAREGGIGVIHKNMTIAEQAAQVRKVKRAENGMIYDPVTISKDHTVGDALNLMKENKIGGIPVVDADRMLIGIVTNRDLRFQRDMSRRIEEVMTPGDRLVTTHNPELSHAQEILLNSKIEKLPVVDDAPFFVKDYHDYYKTPRGYHPRSLNSTDGWNTTSSLSFVNAPILAYANEIRSAVLVIHGDKAHSCYFSRDAFARLQGGNKELLLIPGAVHTDLYDRMDIIPFDRIEAFYRQYLK